MIKYNFIIVISIIVCNLKFENKTINSVGLINKVWSINGNKSSNIIYKKNVLLSLIIGYSWDIIFPFIKSLIKAQISNCDFIMFVHEISQTVNDMLKSFGIIIYEIPENLRNMKIFNIRWKLYSDFLKNNIEKYNIVLSVDIRDTIIQSDLFSLYYNSKPFLAFSYEDATVDRLINKEWIIDKYGIELFKTIKHEKTINAGTVWGTINIFLEFSNILWDKLSAFPESIDQTVINYMIYHENILYNYLKFSNLFGPVMTIGLTKKGNIILDSENNILNYNGKIASIVHQYDRHGIIKKVIRNKFCPELTYKRNIKKTFIFSEIFSIILLVYLLKEKNRNKKK